MDTRKLLQNWSGGTIMQAWITKVALKCQSILAQAIMAPKAKCTIDVSLCLQLLKTHVLSLDGKEYESENMDDIVEHYQTFLCGVAVHTQRLNTTIVQAAAKDLFGGSPVPLKRFAEAMQAALSHCWRVGEKATTGKKNFQWLSSGYTIHSRIVVIRSARTRLQQSQRAIQLRVLHIAKRRCQNRRQLHLQHERCQCGAQVRKSTLWTLRQENIRAMFQASRQFTGCTVFHHLRRRLPQDLIVSRSCPRKK